MRLSIITFVLIGNALAGLPSVPGAQLAAQIQADKLRHHQQQLAVAGRVAQPQAHQQNHPKPVRQISTANGGRILRQQPPSGYQYPSEPNPSFFLPNPSLSSAAPAIAAAAAAAVVNVQPAPPAVVIQQQPTYSQPLPPPPTPAIVPQPLPQQVAVPTPIFSQPPPPPPPTPFVTLPAPLPLTQVPSTQYLPVALPPAPTDAPLAAPDQILVEVIPAVTVPSVVLEPVTLPPFVQPVVAVTTAPPTFIAPATTAPVFNPPATAPPAFIAPATTAPTFAPFAPSTAPPTFAPAPVTFAPAPSAPAGMNMALMPQQPQAQMASIISLEVDCGKEAMVVHIKFDRPFTGLIYSKGHYSNLECHHVRYGGNRADYEFTLFLNSCGSKWVDELASGGKAYLENVIVIQNEEGIQEMWDTARSIRCSWENSLEKTVTYAFNIDMLDSQIVTFSGDTASATLDIQVGKGPNAPSVNGLVKIGDTLTMVVTVEGDPGFDVQVQDCIAHDGNKDNAVTLTDSRGCVLKKKLMGPWQKEKKASSLVAFSFFQAFKFPDQMEVFLECNVELCKNGCDICPDDASLFDIRSRNRRAAHRQHNATEFSDVRLRRSLRVISNEDISYTPNSRSSITLTTGNRQTAQDDVCMSLSSFVMGLVIIMIILIVSCVMTALLCVKSRTDSAGTESIYPPSTASYHAFSSSASGKA